MDVEKTPAYESFVFDLKELLNNDRVLIATYVRYCTINKITRLEMGGKGFLSLSTIRRIEQEGCIGSQESREKLISLLNINVNIDQELITKLNKMVLNYLVYSYYARHEDQWLQYREIHRLLPEFLNTPLSIIFELLDILEDGITYYEAKKEILMLEQLRRFYPEWIGKLIDKVLVICYARAKDSEGTYRALFNIENRHGLDIWDSYARASFPLAMRLIGDKCSEMFYLQNTVDFRDVSQNRNRIYNYTFMARIFLREGNISQGKRFLELSDIVISRTTEIESTRSYVLAYMHFLNDDMNAMIRAISIIRHEHIEHFSTYLLKLYCLKRLNMIIEYDRCRHLVLEIHKQSEDVKITIEFLELLMSDEKPKRMTDIFRRIRTIDYIENTLGFYILETLYNRKLETL